MKKYFDVLEACPLFRGMREEELLSVLDCLGATVAAFFKRETVVAEGDPAGMMGVVLTGSVQIVQVDYFGNRNILARIGPAGLFGESFACAGVETMPVYVTANEDTRILRMDYTRVARPCGLDCGAHQKIMDNLLRVMAAKNLELRQKAEILSKRTTRGKLLAYLLLQAKQQGSCFAIPYDRQELADYLGVDRSGLSAEIGKLKQEGILRSRRNQFELLRAVDA